VSIGEPTVIFHIPGIGTIKVPIPTLFAGDVEVSDVIMALAHKPVLDGLGAYQVKRISYPDLLTIGPAIALRKTVYAVI